MKHFGSFLCMLGTGLVVGFPTFADDVTKPMVVIMPQDLELEVQIDNAPEMLRSIEPQAGEENDNGLIPLDDMPVPEPITNTASPPPGQGALQQPMATPVESQQNTTRAGQANVQAVQPAIDNNAFFDSNDLNEPTELSRRKGARPMDPTRETASTYITVTKSGEAGTQASKTVSAQRAYDLGRYEAALTLYSDLVERYPNDEAALFGKALSMQKLGRDAAAIQMYEAVLDKNPDNMDAQINMMGIMGQRYPAVAAQRLKNLYDNNKNNTALLSQIAIIEANIGRYDSALQYLAIANGIEPQNPNHIYNMAVIADMAGDVKTALNYYEQTLETDAIYGGSRSVPRDDIFTRIAQLR